jgi:hypothetical protein
VLAEIDGREYVPGGATEVDELMDLDFIWDPPKKEGGIDPSMMQDD